MNVEKDQMFLCEWLPCVCVHVAAANVSKLEAMFSQFTATQHFQKSTIHPLTHITHAHSLSHSLRTIHSTHLPCSHTVSPSLSPLQFSKSMSSKTTVKSCISLSLGPCLTSLASFPLVRSSPSMSSLSSLTDTKLMEPLAPADIDIAGQSQWLHRDSRPHKGPSRITEVDIS